MPDDFFNNATGAFGADGLVDVGRPPGTDFFGYLDPDGEDFKTSGDFAFKDSGHTDTWGINGRIEYDLNDSIRLTMVSDFKDYEKLLFIDVDSAPVNQLANYAAVDATSFTQEVRLSGQTDQSSWVLGFYYLYIDTDSDNGLKISPGGVAGPPIDVGTDAVLETESYSVFGQYEWDITTQITLIGGLRLIQEEKDFEMDAGIYVASSDPRAIHQGPKINGLTAVPGLPADTSITTSTSDTLWAGKIQIDYQAFLFTGVGGVVINADAENYGVELELQTTPFEGFDALMSLSWFDATVEDVPNSIGSSILLDVNSTYAPEFQFTALARYEWPMLNGMMNITGDISYSDKYYYNLRNYSADKFDSYTMVNLGLGWSSEDDHWQAGFKVNNVTDERAGIQGFDIATACGCNEISFRAPRWFGFNIRYDY